MQIEIFTVYDTQAKAYLQPFFSANADTAKRAFTACIKDKEHLFGQNPDDYKLYFIGSFFDDSGNIESCESPVLVATGTHVINS